MKIKEQKGATLLEVLIAAALGLIIAVTGVYVLNARLKSVDEISASKEAQSSGESALTALTAVAPDLTDGGAFNSQTDNVLVLAACTPATCDYVLTPDPSASVLNSPAKGFPYGTAIPSGYNMIFLRRWKVETINADYGMRKITVAILSNETDTKPSLIVSTIAGSGRQF